MATVAAEAPGRVNLIGEHTDHSGGFVLPVAIPQRTRVEVAPRGDRRVRVASAALGEGEYALGQERRRGTWLDHVQGVTWALGGLLDRGFDIRITRSVPLGAGLGSSAALAVSLLRSLRDAAGLPLDDLALARLARRSENELVGAPVGIMDQLAAAFGDPEHALFIDTRSLAIERVPLPAALELLVIDSGIAHRHSDGRYGERRRECAAAAGALGVPELRDADLGDLGRIASLREPLDRRARHVVTENARVLAAVSALRSGDLRSLGDLLDASHRSLRDDFQVSLPALDTLVAIARAHSGVLGARLVGGGFGGAVLALARRGAARDAGASIALEYARRVGGRATVLVPPTLHP